ncbi:MAG: glutamine-hydrolyzing GMP synthase [Psittacicella sp.]
MNTLTNIYSDKILILDYGSQYTQLIARRVRALGVYCEVKNWKIKEKDFDFSNPKGIILSGGPQSVFDKNAPYIQDYILSKNIPILGVCYGMQALATSFGGKVSAAKQGEFGQTDVEIVSKSKLIKGMSDESNKLSVWMSHNDQISELPKGFKVIAKTNTCPYAIISNEEKDIYAVQFHAETTHSVNGNILFDNFIKDICKCKTLWSPENIINSQVSYIKNLVGDDKVILGLSGGVDSSVTAYLLNKAIGKNLTCIFIDNGLLRYKEAESVKSMFKGLDLNIEYIDAQNEFLDALKGIDEPEAKRKTIGKVFIDIFSKVVDTYKDDVKWLAQGTIYPDVIESASDSEESHTIKSHHNVGGLPEGMSFQLIEPLRELFKDEVRKIGLELGIPKKLIQRHPFPGPGLGVRVLGEVKKEYCNLLRLADKIFLEELDKEGLMEKTSQAFAVFLPIKSVSVVGDARRYGWVIALRCVETLDFMTATWSDIPKNILKIISSRIINEIPEISRVVYDVSEKPPATIEWE